MNDWTIDENLLARLENGEIRLDHGNHGSFAEGHCAMETVAALAGLGHTNAPACSSRIVSRFVMRLNDEWSDEDRQKLVPYLVRMIGTSDDGMDEKRSFHLADWAVRTILPLVLEKNFTEHASILRNLNPVTDSSSARIAAYAAADAADAAADAVAAHAAAAAADDAAADAAHDAAYAAHAAADAYAYAAAHTAADAAHAAADAYAAAAYAAADAAHAAYAHDAADAYAAAEAAVYAADVVAYAAYAIAADVETDFIVLTLAILDQILPETNKEF